MASSMRFINVIDCLTFRRPIKWLVLLGALVLIISCKAEGKEKKKRITEHVSLLGSWQENDTSETIIWTFNQYEVKWKGFIHTYRLSGDSLIISGLVHRILKKSKKKIELMKFNGKLCTLNRKD